MFQLTAQDIHEWANRRDAQGDFPRLVRRLIRSSGARVNASSFPAEEGVGLPGYDGELETGGTHAWVPTGFSCWELGVGNDPKEKANSDYRKRTKTPGGVTPEQTTFVFVSARVWPGGPPDKRAWAESKHSDGVWKDVRAFDAHDIEQWLDDDPSTRTWLAERMGKATQGLRSTEAVLREFCNTADPALSAGVVIAGRESEKDQLLRGLAGTPTILKVRSETIVESLQFICAAIESTTETADGFHSRAIVVEPGADWRLLEAHSQPLIIVLASSDAGDANVLRNAGHHVLMPFARNDFGTNDAILLPRPGRLELIRVLRGIGCSELRANALVEQSGRSLASLRRILHPAPSSIMPPWAESEDAPSLALLTLIGGWDERSDSDRAMIERLLGRPYSEIESILDRWLHCPEPLFKHAGSLWRISAPLDAWLLLGRRLSRDDLQRFKEVVAEVLETDDPRFELPVDKRWAAPVYGKAMPFSDPLRQGLAESLALLAVFGEQAGCICADSPQGFADMVVRKLLQDANGVRWGSVSGLLPLLAEASPGEVLRAVENSLRRDDPSVLFLFNEEGDHPLGACLHAGLLWALEALAWEPQHLSRVALVLVELAKRDPGGRWANRPVSSLDDIFLVWLRHTAATTEEKLEVLDLICEREPRIGWATLSRLLPRGPSTSTGTHKAVWREWAGTVPDEVPEAEVQDYAFRILERLIRLSKGSVERHAKMLKRLEDLPDSMREELLSDLENLVRAGVSGSLRQELWKEIRETLYWSRRQVDDEESLPATVQQRLEAMYETLEPDDLVDRFGWLFKDGFPHLPSGRQDHGEKFQEAVLSAQQSAVKVVLEASGMEGLFCLARGVSHSYMLGSCVADSLDGDKEEYLLANAVGSGDDKLSSLAGGYISNRIEKNGIEWAHALIGGASTCSRSTQWCADFGRSLPFSAATWERLRACGKDAEELYWKTVYPWIAREGAGAATYAVQRLLDVGRVQSAFSVLESTKEEGIPFGLICEVLERMAGVLSEPSDRAQFSAWDIGEVFKALDRCPDKDDERLGKLEWTYLAVLNETDRGVIQLHAELTDNPEFFADVVSWVYKADDGRDDDDGLDQDQINKRYDVGCEILKRWRGLGSLCGSDGGADESGLLHWVRAAREALAKRNRVTTGDRKLGELLAGTPAGPDGLWPCQAVRCVLEDVTTEDIDVGLLRGKSSARGVTSRSRGEGGQQEREIEANYRNAALKLSAKWPRSAEVLTKLADSFAREAKRFDIRSEEDDLE